LAAVTPDRAVAELAARQYALVTTTQIYEAGFSDEQLRRRERSGQLVPVLRGVHRVGGAPTSFEQRLLAHVLAGGPGAGASHTAAARLWELPGFSDDYIEVSKPRGRSQRIANGRIHGSLWLPDHHLAAVEGIPATTPARTIFDLAGWVHPGAPSVPYRTRST
jgi:hypothetical protein